MRLGWCLASFKMWLEAGLKTATDISCRLVILCKTFGDYGLNRRRSIFGRAVRPIQDAGTSSPIIVMICSSLRDPRVFSGNIAGRGQKMV